jgi:hypothetical protein
MAEDAGSVPDSGLRDHAAANAGEPRHPQVQGILGTLSHAAIAGSGSNEQCHPGMVGTRLQCSRIEAAENCAISC